MHHNCSGYAPTGTSNIERNEEDACYEQLYAVQEGLPRVVIDSLNDKEGFGNPLVEHVVRNIDLETIAKSVQALKISASFIASLLAVRYNAEPVTRFVGL